MPERDLEFVDLPKTEAEKYDWIPGFDEPTAQGLSRQSGESVGGPGQVATAARGSTEGYRRSAIVESTAAGEQFVAPGKGPSRVRKPKIRCPALADFGRAKCERAVADSRHDRARPICADANRNAIYWYLA